MQIILNLMEHWDTTYPQTLRKLANLIEEEYPEFCFENEILVTKDTLATSTKCVLRNEREKMKSNLN